MQPSLPYVSRRCRRSWCISAECGSAKKSASAKKPAAKAKSVTPGANSTKKKATKSKASTSSSAKKKDPPSEAPSAPKEGDVSAEGDIPNGESPQNQKRTASSQAHPESSTKKKKGGKETAAGTSSKLRVKQISPFNFEKWCKANEEILKNANFYEKKCESANDWIAYFDGFPGVAVVKGLWVSSMHAFGWTFH